MSWMTKGGSSSASGRLPLNSQLNELAWREVACTKHEGSGGPRRDCGVDGQRRPQPSKTTNGADFRGAGRASPPAEGVVYLSEGFG